MQPAATASSRPPVDRDPGLTEDGPDDRDQGDGSD